MMFLSVLVTWTVLRRDQMDSMMNVGRRYCSLDGQPPVDFCSPECSLEQSLEMVEELTPVVEAIE